MKAMGLDGEQVCPLHALMIVRELGTPDVLVEHEFMQLSQARDGAVAGLRRVLHPDGHTGTLGKQVAQVRRQLLIVEAEMIRGGKGSAENALVSLARHDE